MLNQIFEIEKKVSTIKESHTITRNLNNLKNLFEIKLDDHNHAKLVIHDPIGEEYDQTRTDCNASIAGEHTEDLVIAEVIKPIIRLQMNGITQIVQQAVVIVQSKEQHPQF